MMDISFEQIAACLAGHQPERLPGNGRTRAAVAMIMRKGGGGLELLLIQRASHDLDPWSGHLAFPGGKVEPGEKERQAAERETGEEVGLQLEQALYLGQLSEITGRTLPVQVSCFVYGVNGCGAAPVLSDEVHASFWVGLDELYAPEHQIITKVTFDGGAHDVPAIRIVRPDTPVLWGLTYRLVMEFHELCIRTEPTGCNLRKMPYTLDV